MQYSYFRSVYTKCQLIILFQLFVNNKKLKLLWQAVCVYSMASQKALIYGDGQFGHIIITSQCQVFPHSTAIRFELLCIGRANLTSEGLAIKNKIIKDLLYKHLLKHNYAYTNNMYMLLGTQIMKMGISSQSKLHMLYW